MIETSIIARQWGNSIGFALPKDIVEKAGIKPNSKVYILIREERKNLVTVFGTLRFGNSAQTLIDEARKGEK